MRSSHQTVSWITISRCNLPALSRFLLSSALLLLRTGLAFPATPTRCSRWLCACRMHAACRVGSSLRQPMHTPAATACHMQAHPPAFNVAPCWCMPSLPHRCDRRPDATSACRRVLPYPWLWAWIPCTTSIARTGFLARILPFVTRTSCLPGYLAIFDTQHLYNNCLFSNWSCIIWLGDLNYWIALSYCSAKALVEMHNWKQLLKKDQVICSSPSILFISILLQWVVQLLRFQDIL
jgi:hypothetical protein